ncbi:MAG: YihY/virulence factor BrkB family protein [Actinomycetota bacterium]
MGPVPGGADRQPLGREAGGGHGRLVRGRPGLNWIDGLERRLPGPARRVVRRSRGQDILLFASGLSFYALVSVVPLTIFVIWISSLILGDQRIHQFAGELKRVAPKNLDAGGFVQRVSDLGTSLGVPALVTALWPASSYGAGLRRAFDRLGPKKSKELPGLKGRGLALVALLPVFILGSLLGAFAGTALFPDGVWQRILGIVLALMIGFAATAVGVALIYAIFPPERLPIRSVLKGTLWSAPTIALLSMVFAVFVANANFQEHYGTSGVGALVLLAVWLFLANALLLVGYRIALDT